MYPFRFAGNNAISCFKNYRDSFQVIVIICKYYYYYVGIFYFQSWGALRWNNTKSCYKNYRLVPSDISSVNIIIMSVFSIFKVGGRPPQPRYNYIRGDLVVGL